MFNKIIMYIIKKLNIFFVSSKYKKIIMFHIPKCSGTSVKSIFLKYCGKESFFQKSDYLPLTEKDFTESKKNIFIGHKTFNYFNEKNIFQFTILRYPIDIYISYYFSHLNFDKKNNYKKLSSNIIQKKKMKIIDFVPLIKKKQFDNICTRFFSNKINMSSIDTLAWDETDNFSEKYVVDETDLKKAIDNLKKINVYTLENINRKKLFQKINFKIIYFEDLKVNKSIKTTNLNENDLKLLESVCDFDQRLYQYFIENKLVNKY